MEDIATQPEPPSLPAGGWSPDALPGPAAGAPEDVLIAEAREPGPDGAEPESGPTFETALDRVEAAVAAGFAGLSQEFRDKLALDHFKEDQIARLHEELQAYKADFIQKTARQILQGLIRLHDDLGKTTVSLRQKPVEELTPERFFQQFAGFQDDIELLLGQHGVERFEAEGEAFDPRRQTALRTVAVDDSGRVGRVAERLRPGFEQGEVLLQKERVSVYVAINGNNDKAQGGQS
jgi:molecular chaperone GrpE (heat shock protein)